MDGDYLNIDWTAALAEMEAKRDALNVAIEGLRAALEAGSLPGGTPPPPGSPGPVAPKTPNARPVSMGRPMPLPRGALLGKAAPEAIKVYLDAEKEKRTNRQIADALKQGGVESTSSNFDAFINSALFRLKKDGSILRFDDGWGLAEWYPESFRSRVGEKKLVNGGKRKAKKKAADKAAKTTQAKTDSAAPQAKAAKKVGVDQEIMGLFGAQNREFVSDAEELGILLGTSERTLKLALGRLRSKGKLEKTANGGYQLAGRNIQEMPNAKAS